MCADRDCRGREYIMRYAARTLNFSTCERYQLFQSETINLTSIRWELLDLWRRFPNVLIGVLDQEE